LRSVALGRAFVERSTRSFCDLGLHELASKPGKTFAQEVGIFVGQELAQELLKAQSRLAIVVLLSSFPCNGSNDCAAHGGRLLPGLRLQDLHHTTGLNLPS
jgi:hypothetical protein